MSNITECLIYRHSIQHPDDIAIKTDTEELSYKDLHLSICSAQSNIKEMGIKRSDTIAIIQEKSRQFITVILACFREGITVCPLNPKWPSKLIETELEKLGPTFCWHSDDISISFLSNRLVLDKEPLTKDINPHEWRYQITPSQITTILWSSGSTGHHKIIVHRYNNHYYSALGSNKYINIERGDTWLLSLPLYHVSGLSILFRTFMVGATLRLSKKPIQTSLHEDKITHISMVHTQLNRLLGDDYRVQNGLKAILVGGSAIPEKLIQESLGKGYPIYTSYGLSEMSSQVCTNSYKESPHINSSGKCLPFREIKIDRNNHILVKGYTLFSGYYSNGTISLPLDNEGWFDTGDIGHLNEGCLHVTGRHDTMFISGGENIYPEEIEIQLCNITEIDYAMIVPIPNDDYGFRPIAFIQTNDSELQKHLSQNTLPKNYIKKLRTQVAPYKIPDQFYIWPKEVPCTKQSRQILIEKVSPTTQETL